MLSWDASYEIVLALQTAYPDIEIESVSLEMLSRMIITLPDFGDDPSLVNDGILMAILREWYEENNS